MSTERPPPDDDVPADDAARRRALRRIARRHHPDVGGDLDTYLREVAALEGRSGGRPRRPIRVVVLHGPAWRRTLARLRRLARRRALDRQERRRREVDDAIRRKSGTGHRRG